MVFPFDFGFIPGTKGEDGDPLDAMVISELTTFPGCRLACRLIGALKAQQTEKGKTIGNDRYFFIPEIAVNYKHIRSMHDVGRTSIKELFAFFVNYNKLEGKDFKPLKMLTARQAEQVMNKSMQ